MNNLLKSKTIWTCAIAIITAISAYCTGEINAQAMIGAILLASIHIFQRTATDKVAADVTQVKDVQAQLAPVTTAVVKDAAQNATK